MLKAAKQSELPNNNTSNTQIASPSFSFLVSFFSNSVDLSESDLLKL